MSSNSSRRRRSRSPECLQLLRCLCACVCVVSAGVVCLIYAMRCGGWVERLWTLPRKSEAAWSSLVLVVSAEAGALSASSPPNLLSRLLLIFSRQVGEGGRGGRERARHCPSYLTRHRDSGGPGLSDRLCAYSTPPFRVFSVTYYSELNIDITLSM